jgi:hypothetical protein
MASTNKCLAQINKSRTDSNATKEFTSRAAQFVRWPSQTTAQRYRLFHDGAIVRIKFEATDASGKVHKRSSTTHVYSHCLVIHFSAHPPSKLWPKGIAACSHAEWVRSCALAERKASRWRKEPDVEAIEVLEARQV